MKSLGIGKEILSVVHVPRGGCRHVFTIFAIAMVCTKFANTVIRKSEIRFYELQLDSFQRAQFLFDVVLLISSAICSGFIQNKTVSVAISELCCKWQEFF